MKYVAAMVSVAAMLLSAPAFAQDGAGAEGEGVIVGEDGAVYEAETNYNFEDDIVEGALLAPDGDLLTGSRHGKTSSLINIRADFVPEMVRSVEEL